MKQDPQDSQYSQATEPEHHEPSHHDSHRVGTLREHLVRETLSDLENQLTADHHLNKDFEAESDESEDSRQ
ncbi:MAG TPA: hypothetical protein VH988_22100 [Thermoanaerobaculia bacterium]|jgi:hypothetical protein|nr:hypothetical protein [Thermoanaerobaculia bacterium]